MGFGKGRGVCELDSEWGYCYCNGDNAIFNSMHLSNNEQITHISNISITIIITLQPITTITLAIVVKNLFCNLQQAPTSRNVSIDRELFASVQSTNICVSHILVERLVCDDSRVGIDRV